MESLLSPAEKSATKVIMKVWSITETMNYILLKRFLTSLSQTCLF